MKKIIISLFLIFGLYGATYCSILPEPTVFTPCDYPTPIENISGRVTTSNGAGLASVTVTLLSHDSVEVCDITTTSLSGYYTLMSVYSPQYYYIRFAKKGYVGQDNYVYVYPNQPTFTYNTTLLTP